MRLYCGENSVKKKPYLHILRDHIPNILMFWYKKLNWGYGYFSCMAGEHLNKQIKTMEVCETNQGNDRFKVVMRMMRIRQFHFTSAIFKETVTITCSRCKLQGHNRKNKSCPMHPDQPELTFADTDDEQ